MPVIDVAQFPEQREKAFQKQPGVLQHKKRAAVRKKGQRTVVSKIKESEDGPGGVKVLTKLGSAPRRWYRDIGLGYKTPKRAIHGSYIDPKCPFTGNTSVRGRIISGIVHSVKSHKTVVVRRTYLLWRKKYKRYEKRHKNVLAHLSPCFRVNLGDRVVMGQCRPLSKTKRSVVIEVHSKPQRKISQFEKF